MSRWLGSLFILAIGCLAAVASAQSTPSVVRVTQRATGTVQTQIGFHLYLNAHSTLMRQGVVIHDSRLPVRLPDSLGVSTVQGDGYYYKAAPTIAATEPITAVEIRYLIFNLWGEHVHTLTETEVLDLAPGDSAAPEARWVIPTVTEAATYLASVAFVARVRTQSGRVIAADLAPVLQEAAKFSKTLRLEDLAPEKSTQAKAN